MQAKNPATLVEKSGKGMLPKNKLGAELFKFKCCWFRHKQDSKPRTVNLNDLKWELFTKSVEKKTLLRCLCFGRNRSNHCKQKNLQLISLQLLVQSYTTNVYDRERNF
jgi:hypothetical protein